MNYQQRILTLTALPLLFSIGCVSTNQKQSMTEPAVKESESITESIDQQAVANMDGYLKQLAADEASETSSNESDINIHEVLVNIHEVKDADNFTDVVVDSPSSETTTLTENIELIDVNNSSSTTIMESEMLITSNTFREKAMATTPENQTEKMDVPKNDPYIDAIATTNEIAENISTNVLKPEKEIFHFSFNKNQPFYDDLNIINQHAQYLIQNPDMIVSITGHSDKRGNWDYNLRLSELRAKNIATILISAGVSESQLRIEGMSDSIPLVLPENWSENRRVELMYQASVVASTK